MQHFRVSNDAIRLINLHVQTQLAHAGAELNGSSSVKKKKTAPTWDVDRVGEIGRDSPLELVASVSWTLNLGFFGSQTTASRGNKIKKKSCVCVNRAKS